MTYSFRLTVLAAGVLAPILSHQALARTPEPQPPSVIFGDLYRAVEMAQIFPDQKTFADAIPMSSPASIMKDYAAEKGKPDFKLADFVQAHFKQPVLKTVSYQRRAGETVSDYINDMWTVLLRQPDEAEPYSSLLTLPAPYIVPGGRFSEIYYWDTYFTMLGLEQDGQGAIARDMLRNIASLITRYGHMPNGNRSYYLSRSQPPFFSAMVDLLAQKNGPAVYKTYLPVMRTEYEYWMQGAADLKPGQASGNVVKLADGTLLNRFWSASDTPRDESFREDIETAKTSRETPSVLYRNLRAGAESGWDYSSRWFADGRTMSTIDTTDILPVDLNSEMFHLESALSYAYGLDGNKAEAKVFAARAAKRQAAIQHVMWDSAEGDFHDYNWKTKQLTPVLSAATVVPLFFHVATDAEGARVATVVQARLLAPGGILTTTANTGQQWDAPNGWAPLQWMAVQGFRNYGNPDLAKTIAERWETRVNEGFARDGVLVEKYNVAAPAGSSAGGHGGEYALQVGFGWTNGVQAALMAEYPLPQPKAATTAPAAASP
ncbi:alpha,alpha-trehalase TreF [Acidisoma cellulosilytica]|uniref:Alpha,alpha-trehalase TreF n=1 Tax=Acidisoma cellulosilyticum TaxID=2802395 RepID=A0A963Z4H7_9PROT|nr:alpha,alpha-trehalase TreF [Acidisoma cellulosilyticum]MCB8882474.1 alpha,alpha-trehalase TreF [Acidisoma cellulosilyticum]